MNSTTSHARKSRLTTRKTMINAGPYSFGSGILRHPAPSSRTVRVRGLRTRDGNMATLLKLTLIAALALLWACAPITPLYPQQPQSSPQSGSSGGASGSSGGPSGGTTGSSGGGSAGGGGAGRRRRQQPATERRSDARRQRRGRWRHAGQREFRRRIAVPGRIHPVRRSQGRHGQQRRRRCAHTAASRRPHFKRWPNSRAKPGLAGQRHRWGGRIRPARR